jgi:hypothetical protein
VAKQLSDVDVAWLVGLVVSGASYWLLSRSVNVRAELDEAAHENTGTVNVIT